jgi:mannosyltransferase
MASAAVACSCAREREVEVRRPRPVAFVDRLWNPAEVTSIDPAEAAVREPLPHARAGIGRAPSAERDVAARVLLVLALAVGLLRFFRLGEWSLWFDEAATWTDAHISLEDREISNPIGYRLIQAAVNLLGGVPDELSLRALPALLGWCVIPLAWWTFRPFAGSRRSAAAALFLASSSWHVYWSQNARFYTMAQFVSLAGAAFVLRGLWKGKGWLAALGLSIAGSAALLHPSAGLVLPALAVAPWATRAVDRATSRAWARPALAMIALLALGLVVRLDWVRETWRNYQLHKSESNPAHFILTCGFYFTPVWLAAAAVGVAWAAWRRDAFHSFAAAVVVLVVAAGLAMSMSARISAQYVFVVLPWVAILAAAPLAAAPSISTSPRTAVQAAWIAVIVLPTLVATALYFTVRKGERPQWREAYEYVWNQREENDLVLGMEATVGEFYLAPRRTDLRQPVHVTWLDKWRARLPEVWARHARRAWYILNPEQLLDWDPRDADDFRAFLRQECRLVKCFPLYVESRDLSVWIYIRD